MVKKSEQRNPQKGDIVIATPYREDFKKEFE